ncbi:SIMPL domain-containing protein [Acidisoma cellulosilytica]|uniref:SIMPL domain-containing protein n=1 Tax=Acidisoma cellulosilyticum TaxID=2802395 RepID=A0A963YXM3_9PROT|nr:SIMPL domain-containing protein [Acidisoma cellulosilyticum]MCB8878724.1 SIMPL domain-containing protein [Acidisoma cellulosilyticum]
MQRIAGLIGASGLAAALLAAPAAHADTLLHLSVTASVTAMPDELVAQLTAQADAPTAGDAQQQVNAMIAKALGDAKSLDAVTASTTNYSVWHETDPKDVWHASQGIALRAHDGGALLGLIGKLQQDGLAVGDLTWQLSPALSEKTYEQAMAKAIGKLTAQADVVAKLMHLQAHGFTSVTVGDDAQPGPRPMMRMMATAAPAAAPPPSAQADAVTVSASVSGDARLQGE